MLFLQLPPVHSPSTARPPDPDLRSRSSISSLLPCYFCSSRPSTARPPPVHRILTFDLAPPVISWTRTQAPPMLLGTRWAREPKRQTRHTQANILCKVNVTCPLCHLGHYIDLRTQANLQRQPPSLPLPYQIGMHTTHPPSFIFFSNRHHTLKNRQSTQK